MNKYIIICLLVLMVSVSGCSQQNNSSGQTNPVPTKNPITVEEATKLIQQKWNGTEGQKIFITNSDQKVVPNNVKVVSTVVSVDYAFDIAPGQEVIPDSVKIVNSTDNEANVEFALNIYQENPDGGTNYRQLVLITKLINENGEWKIDENYERNTS